MKTVSLFLIYLMAPTVYAQLPVTINKSFVSNSKYEITLVDEKPLKPTSSLLQFLFEVKSKSTGKISQITIGDRESRFRALTNLHLFNNNVFVVEGELKRASTITVFDLKKSKQVDMFWCYGPTPSHSKRFWVYKKFIPYHGVPPGVMSSVALVYDMSKSPEKNRVPVISYTPKPKAYVGIPIYPASHANAKAYLVPEQLQANLVPGWQHIIVSPFLWSNDGRQVVFLCTHLVERYDRPHIVRIDLSAGVDRPRIFERPIILTHEFFKSANPRATTNEIDESRRENRLFSADKIEWLGSNQVVIRPSRHGMKEEIILPVP